MTEFRVKAGWPDGSVGEQSVMAIDGGAARMEVERRGGHVFEVKRKGFTFGGEKAKGRGRVKMSEFLIFNQELIALLKAGLPVVRCFEILLERQKSPTLRRVLTDVRERVNSGSSISEAFAEEGDLFPRLYWTSLKAGEKSGEIESVLRRYLKYQKTVMALSRKVVSTLVYPAILIVLSAGLITILMTYVIPRFTEFFADFNADLPLLTVVVLTAANFLKANILIIIAIVGGGGYVASRWFKTTAGPGSTGRS
jgi:type IV pilus assembly protein PilC